ncbi:WYL domain-containing protein [Isoptericola sp. NEAU-Y5]|uniref:WYL domain-containing protein n=1 Tax=Isoptericola luteus TaxID=2879484 RepID=A0ABS7ZL92_9MICO|nr:WYL domain-containing protein [Isoptericola sp. NEAU-Y5]MCA5894866.1 WYL domain-containing protein [Isoptericola sp. NEAU-Y5]MCA5895242.1 WYL domain-containing protein [Isoptericola sp. NEAU-Y5]
MRADRLIQVLLHLQSRPRVTAAELAADLEVSVATARRDLEALSTAGVPVYSQPGRGGGWSLLGGSRTDLSGLTAPEARALFLLAGPGAASSDDARAALRKLVRALPATFRAEAEAAAAAVVVDRERWSTTGRERPAGLGELQQAVVERRRVRIDYTGATGRTSRRDVDPWGLVDKDGIWYLVAGTPHGSRAFRVDRIGGLEVTDEHFTVPAGLDLGAEWERVVGEVEERRSATWTTVVVRAEHVGVLGAQFGRHTHVEGPVPGGGRDGGDDGDGGDVDGGDVDDGDDGDGSRARVRVGAPTPLDVARHLAGWGAQADVEGPPEVQAELARLGAELVARYGPGGQCARAATRPGCRASSSLIGSGRQGCVPGSSS